MNTVQSSETEHTGYDVQRAAVIGAGSIGISWAMLFASAGILVRVYESNETARALILAKAKMKLADLNAVGLLAETAEAVMQRITICETLEEALVDVDYVQESVVEDLNVKRELFAALDRLTPETTVLASSTSTIVASNFAADLPGRARCLVVHPGNPPYFLRVAEIVPAEFTAPRAVDIARSVLLQSGIAPIMLNQEIEGFAFNRLQGALLREAYCLVRDGIVSPADIDTIVREGLGRRWSLIGPFTTSELNTRGGLRRHAEVIGPVYARLGIERADENPWTPETIDRVAREIEAQLPHDAWEDNVKARDRAMIQLSALLRQFENPLDSQSTL